jgi:acetyl-CoA acetyltransferase
MTTDSFAPFRDQCAIAGVGATVMSRNSGRSALSLATEAALKALDDAGMTAADVGGILNCDLDTVVPLTLSATIGAHEVTYWGHTGPGGHGPCMMIALAVGAILSGQAKAVLCFRALNGRSESRLGTGVPGLGKELTGGFATYDEFYAPYGLLTAGQLWALIAQRHMMAYGTTPEHLGEIAIACREAATLTPGAQMHDRPLTMEDYLASRMIATPLRLNDFCLETDGACAVVITSAERARDTRHTPALIRAVAAGGPLDNRPGMVFPYLSMSDITEIGGFRGGETLWSRAGVSPKEVDVAQLYDCFTISVLMQLEAYGFCRRGEGGPFVASGAVRRDGVLPINTSGGHLSGGYIHGMNLIIEGVQQMRREAAMQIPDAELCLCTGGPMAFGSSVLLRRDA